jgi:hypothetical protein
MDVPRDRRNFVTSAQFAILLAVPPRAMRGHHPRSLIIKEKKSMIENNIACNSAIQQQLDQKKNITIEYHDVLNFD